MRQLWRRDDAFNGGSERAKARDGGLHLSRRNFA